MNCKLWMPVILVMLLFGCGGKPVSSPVVTSPPTATTNSTATASPEVVTTTPPSSTPLETPSPTLAFTPAPTPTPTPGPVQSTFHGIGYSVSAGAVVTDADGVRKIVLLDGDLPKTSFELKVLDIDPADSEAVKQAASDGLATDSGPTVATLGGETVWQAFGLDDNTYAERLTFAHNDKVYCITAHALGCTEPIDEDRFPILTFFYTLVMM